MFVFFCLAHMFSKYFKTLSLQVALEKLKLEQDVTAAEGDNQKKKKDVARLLKNALGVEIKEKLIGRLLSVFNSYSYSSYSYSSYSYSSYD